MLLKFSVSNWRSIRETLTLSLIASREQQHAQRLLPIRKFALRILPNALLFGPNGSGKSSYVEAIAFVQGLIGTRDDRFLVRHLEPYRLDEERRNGPSHFELHLYLNGLVYKYRFSCTKQLILSEQLIRINSASEEILYQRAEQRFHFSEKFEKAQIDHLSFLAQGTKRHQLFLNNIHHQNFSLLDGIYEAIAQRIRIIRPQSPLSVLPLDKAETALAIYNAWLPRFDTGIESVELCPITAEQSRISQDDLDDALRNLSEPSQPRLLVSPQYGILIEVKGGQAHFFRLDSFHCNQNGQQIRLTMAEESDGSKRLLCLIPAFCQQANGEENCYVLDEVDRSLHTLLTLGLFQVFHHRCAQQPSDQIVATTHDIGLMTQKAFRRDEMWIFDRSSGASDLVACSDFIEAQKDKDLRKSYLSGRMGGVPQFSAPELMGE